MSARDEFEWHLDNTVLNAGAHATLLKYFNSAIQERDDEWFDTLASELDHYEEDGDCAASLKDLRRRMLEKLAE